MMARRPDTAAAARKGQRPWRKQANRCRASPKAAFLIMRQGGQLLRAPAKLSRGLKQLDVQREVDLTVAVLDRSGGPSLAEFGHALAVLFNPTALNGTADK